MGAAAVQALQARPGMASVCGAAWITHRRLLREPYPAPSGSSRPVVGSSPGQRVRLSLDDAEAAAAQALPTTLLEE